METMKLLNKWRRKLSYLVGKRDFIYDTAINEQVSDVIFERDVIVYVVNYRNEYGIYTIITCPYNKGFEV